MRAMYLRWHAACTQSLTTPVLPSPCVCGVPTALHAGPWRTALQRWARARCTAGWCALSAGARASRNGEGVFENATCCSSLAAYHHIPLPHPQRPASLTSLARQLATLLPACTDALVLFSHATLQGLSGAFKAVQSTTGPRKLTPIQSPFLPNPPSPTCSVQGLQSNVLFAWVLRHHLACQVDLLPALSCHSPHSPRHHHSPPSSSCRSSRQPPVPAATLNAASPAAAPSPDHAAACVVRLSSPADSAQQPVQSASAAASSASAELADHMCLLVHINGMAWLADVSTPCCPTSLLPHPMFLEPLLFQPGIHQHQDAGVYRISPCPPPHPPAPASAAPWVRGRGAGAVSVAPACTAESQEKPVAAVAAAGRGGEGWRAVERGVHGWAVEHVEEGMDRRTAERSAGGEADSDSDPDDADDDDDDFYTEGVRGDGTPCPPRLTHAAGGQAAAAAAAVVRAGEQWYVVERLCRVGPSEAGGRWAGADGEQAAWGEAACEEEAQWQPLYRFSSWPRDAPHFLQCMLHASPLGGPRVAVRVCSEGEREAEGREVIREMICDRHLLLLDGDGRVQ
ncbi:unnamed protein product, partial [Closterium sp. NIES-54]